MVFDISASLGNTLLGSDGSESLNNTNRVPFAFTSTFRLRKINPRFGTSEARELSAVGILGEEAIELQDPPVGTPRASDTLLPIIEMLINPNSISWRQPKRITKRDTQEGSIFFHFTNSRGENNDILTMEFRGNTGNIDLRGDTPLSSAQILAQDVSTGAFRKLLVWQNLWDLTREKMLLKDNVINEFLIIYASPAIPIQISLIGHFSEVMTWTDNADKPYSKDYSFSFTVQEVVPPLNDLAPILQSSSFDASEPIAGTV